MRNEQCLTSIVFNTHALDSVLDVGQCTQTSNKPAITERTLLHIPGIYILHKRGLFEDLVNSLNSFRDGGTSAKFRAADIELPRAQVVKTVTLEPFEVPVLL